MSGVEELKVAIERLRVIKDKIKAVLNAKVDDADLAVVASDVNSMVDELESAIMSSEVVEPVEPVEPVEVVEPAPV